MPLSTSNSNQRLPQERYALQWGFAILLFIVLLLLIEWRVESGGLQPSVMDTKDTWSIMLQRAITPPTQDKVVVLGASRAELGFDPAEFEALTHHPTYLLAINGHEPKATLQYIAEQTHFDGTVIVSFRSDWVDPWFYDGFISQQPWVDYYQGHYTHLGRLETMANANMRTWLQHKFAFLAFNWKSYKHGLPAQHLIRQPNRQLQAHYNLLPKEKLNKERQFRINTAKARILRNAHPNQQQWLAHLVPLQHWVDLIQARGGRVILVRYPTTNEHWRFDEQQFPRKKFWRQLAHKTHAKTLHFNDIKSARKLHCPETSHLPYEEAKTFTKELAARLQHSI